MKKRMNKIFIIAAVFACVAGKALACTGITLKSGDGAKILARTIEWGGSDLNSCYVVVPRGHVQTSWLLNGTKAGIRFEARYGYVGLAVEKADYVSEGINEAGLSAGLFYFPNYGEYEQYDSAHSESTISDLQLVPWLLASFKTVDEAVAAIRQVHVTFADSRGSTVHWRIADGSGRQVVVEIIGGKPEFYDNKIGVLTNSPGFEWHVTNLNNYVNLYPGAADSKTMEGVTLSPFGAGTGFLGIPGDVTPPSRFVRAAFYQTSAPKQPTALKTVLQAFQILNNFDIPVGIEFKDGKVPSDIPSATQWTSVSDLTNKVIYYRTMYNSMIRCIDLKAINFAKVKYRAMALDEVRQQPVSTIVIK